MPWAPIAGAGISAAGSVVGGLIGAGAQNKAAKMQQDQANMTRQELLPFVLAGGAVAPSYANAVLSGPTGGGPDYLSMAANMLPGTMTQAELEATPGYKFTLDQGLRATQSGIAARGLGVSGAALKAASQYATNLANQTYQDQFKIAQTRFSDMSGLSKQQQDNLNAWTARLHDAATLGENAASATGTATSQLYSGAANATAKAGEDTALGISGIGNAINQGFNNYFKYNQYQQNAPPPVGGGSGGGSGGGNALIPTASNPNP